MILLLLPVVPLATVEKKTTPLLVEVLTPFKIAFLTVLLVAAFMKRMVAPLVLVFETVKSLLEPPTEFDPSITTKVAPFRSNMVVVLEPLIVGVTPVAGLIVRVLTALDPLLAFIVIGNVSPAE